MQNNSEDGKDKMSYESLTEKVKEANDIVEVIKEKTNLKMVGSNWVGLCVFHNDRHKPNLTVFPDSQSFYCFACGVGGDVISFVMQEKNMNFCNALRFLAERKGIPFPLNGELPNDVEVKIRDAGPALREAAILYHQNLPPEVREYLGKERGLTDETIDQNLIGFCAGKTTFRTSKEKIVEAGLLYESGKEFFDGFITFPYFHNGRIVYMTGRGYPEKAHKKLPKEKVPLMQPYRGKVIKKGLPILTEGEIDTLTLLQNGFNAYGIPGAESFKDEWAEKFKSHELVYITFDGDAAGKKGSHMAAQALGSIARIIRLPDGEDVNDYFRHAAASDYQELLYKAMTLIQAKVSDISASTPKTELPRVLDPIIREVATLEVTQGDAEIYNTVKDYFHLSNKEIQSYVCLLKKYRKQREEQEDEDKHHTQEELIEILRQDDGKRKIDPAQDFQDGILYFTVMVNGTPCLLTSNRRLMNFAEAESKGIVFCHKEVDMSCFSPKGITQFLEGQYDINPKRLYNKIHDYISRFVVFTDSRQIAYLTLWVLGTYLFRIFRYFPYAWLNAEKSSGKSLLMEILSAIAFNSDGDLITNPSPATIYRDVANNRVTLFLDEMEKLRKEDKDAFGDIMRILNVGFSQSGTVKRMEKNSDGKFSVKKYSAYSPKMFAGINDIDDVLRDRTFRIRLLRKKDDEKAERYKQRDAILALQREIRDELYIFALTYAKQIADLYFKEDGTIKGMEHLSNRELDIWEPIITLANFIDASCTQNELTKAMESLSLESTKEKQEDSVTKNETCQILEVFKNMISGFGDADPETPLLGEEDGMSIFDAEKVFNYFKKTDEFSWIQKKNTLTIRIVKKAGVVSTQRRFDGEKKRVYLLNLKNFWDLYKRYVKDNTDLPPDSD